MNTVQRIHRQYLDEHDLDATCDEVLIPALKRIRSDHDADDLSDADANRLFVLAAI